MQAPPVPCATCLQPSRRRGGHRTDLGKDSIFNGTAARRAELTRQIDTRGPSAGQNRRRKPVLVWAVTFLIVAIIAGVLGFGGIAGTSAGIAQILFVIFLILFFISLLRGAMRR
jgi:uncharacterized membrane protein YtjA (UPF0391 family)